MLHLLLKRLLVSKLFLFTLLLFQLNLFWRLVRYWIFAHQIMYEVHLPSITYKTLTYRFKLIIIAAGVQCVSLKHLWCKGVVSYLPVVVSIWWSFQAAWFLVFILLLLNIFQPIIGAITVTQDLQKCSPGLQKDEDEDKSV